MKRLRIGIVGLPNVGKSSFFELISKKQVLVANYPFSTISSNSAPVSFCDEKVLRLGNFFKSKKITFATYELVDIAGIIKGASQKVGLGGEFLSNIRSVDLICHLVRCFENNNIVHTEENIDPVRDIGIIRFEFINADLQQLTRRIEKIEKTSRKENDKQLLKEKALLQKIINKMNEEIPVSEMELTEEEKAMIKDYNLLTNKPSIIVANYNFDNTNEIRKLEENCHDKEIISIDIGLENEYKNFSIQEKEEFGYSQFNLQKLSSLIIERLQLKSFFTAGESESRNWIIHAEANAAECAGMIHSDIRRKFVRAEIFHVSQIDSDKNTSRKESALYIVKNGDVCNFLSS